MTVSYLRLVHDKASAANVARARFEHVQEPLLPATEHTVAICAADGLSENLIRSLAETLKPRLILDFRTTPRFDFGALNRGKALDLFDAIEARYLDVGYTLRQGADDMDAFAEAVAGYVASVAKDAPTASALALVDPSNNFERAGLAAIQRLRDRTRVVWELLLFERGTSDDSLRKILFISHANPEDNEVTFWLQTQLTRLGYEVWTDLTHLKAGDVFWDSIEDTIRNKAARVIVLVSRKSMQKPGVLDEISLAVSIERAHKLNRFVIPVRVDDIPYSELRANIARKNVIDFHSSWASGFAALSFTLSQDRIPKQRQAQGLSLSSWWGEQRPASLSVVEESENLISNRFPVSSLPLRVYTFSGTPEYQGDTRQLPLMLFRNQWLSFFSDVELRNLGVAGLSRESTLATSELFAGNLSLTAQLPDSARQRVLHGMLNRLWACFILRRGLKLYSQSGAQPIPYIPDGLVTNNTAHFRDSEGIQRKRLLVGHSTKRSLYWHLAPTGGFLTASRICLSLKLRVLFSVDGHCEWPSIERMRTTRRSFCKNWWNDRWLSLQTAFMSWLANGTDEIEIYAGEGGRLAVQCSPLSYQSPMTIREAYSKSDDEGQTNELDGMFTDDWLDVDSDGSDETESQEGAP